MSHYGVSERLQGMMCTEPVKHTARTAPNTPKVDARSRGLWGSQNIPMDDLEGACTVKELDSLDKLPSLRNLTFAQVANSIWHFCSVDHGLRCMQTTFTQFLMLM